MSRPAQGDVERTTRAFVKTLGTLTARNAALAAAAIRCARLLDLADSGAGATALARELRQALVLLEPNRANVPAPAPETVQARQDSVDEVAEQLRKRRARQAGRPA
jgi:hypothetical protein